ncbi:MAG: MFS transporter [Legionellales bacterium]|nr:MFS transporter [Legionellales bacterium]
MTDVSNPNKITNSMKWLITITVMSVAVIEVLDMTIVNVALPNMMGSLGASSDQITWVLTSYIVSSAICMPLTGFLVNWMGRKRLLLINIIGFLLTSALSGMAVNLSQIVLFRTLQGIFGATLVPMSQYILRDTFPQEEQGTAMAVWGIGIMAGPVLGPTLGGYITETLNWRWVFYINIPVCIMAFFMTLKFIQETPRKKVFVDWLGLGLLTIGIGAMQIVLDRGNQENWFNSNFIIILTAISAYCLVFFIIRGLRYAKNIIDLKLFKDFNFSSSTIMLTLYCISMFGLLTLLPIMLENLMNYPVGTTGWDMAPRGITCAISMAMMAKLINKVDTRFLIAIGLLFTAAGSYMMTQFSLNISEYYVLVSGAIQGFGMGFFFVPISTMALATLPAEKTAEGSGLFSFGRSLGSSIGISLFSTILSQESQINWNRLGGYLTPSNPELQQWLFAHHLTLANPTTPQLLGQTLAQQSTMIAFVDCYWLGMVLVLIMLPILFFIKKPSISQGLNVGH